MAKYQIYIVASHLMTLIVIFYAVIYTARSCNVGLKTFGVTYPHGDIAIEYGKPLEIYCILNDDYVKEHGPESSRNLGFFKNDSAVPDEMVEIVNASTIRLYVEKPPLSGSMYYCHEKTKNHNVCLNSVIVGTKPQPPKNFTCIGYNFDNMTCSWIAPENYVKTNYSLVYHFIARNSREIFHCPKIRVSSEQPNKMECYLDLRTDPFYRQSQPTYFFTLRMSNILGNDTFKYVFSHFANVVPGPPYNLTVINKTTESILLSWTVQTSMKYFPSSTIQKVIYRSEYDSEWITANTSVLNVVKHPYNYVFNLTDLQYGHALYDIRVSMRSARSLPTDDHLWSKFASVTTRTMSKIPESPPKTNIGSFESVNRQDDRDIYVFWQYIPDYMKNGENCTYKIISVEEDSIKKNLQPQKLTNTFAKFNNLLTRKSYKFVITSSNEIGLSKKTSSIFVPAVSKKLSRPKGFTNTAFQNENTYELSWLPPDPETERVENYTLFWCRNEREWPYKCKGYLQWEEVPGSVTAHNITIPENQVTQFAISANSKHGSSGMVWATCTIIHNQGGGKMKRLTVEQIGSTYMEIGLNLECADGTGNPEAIKVYYCPIISPVESVCKESEKMLIISRSKIDNKVNVTDLRPYTLYMLSVSVIGKHAGNSLQSEPLFNTTLEAVPDTPPQNVTLHNVTNSSVIVTWAPPLSMNGVLRYYEIYYVSKYGTQTKKCEPVAEKNGSRAEYKMVLENLKSYTDYNISVTACTISCTEASRPVTIRTAIATPGVINEPNIRFQNISVISISWLPPKDPGGKLDIYEVRIKEKTTTGNTSKILNTTESELLLPNCHEEETPKTYYFSVRAINFKNDKRYAGNWSEEYIHFCTTSLRFVYYLFFGIIAICSTTFLLICVSRRIWNRCQLMSDVEVKLPPGLAPPIPCDVNLHHWPDTNKSLQNEDSVLHMRTDTSADEELLLNKKTDSIESPGGIISGDSSGCSSGQESVISSLASGNNLSNTLDSGTEQPNSASNESMNCENSLRLRRTGSDSAGWNLDLRPQKKSYVTIPNLEKNALPISNWSAKKTTPSSNYCVLGVNNNSSSAENFSYVPISDSFNDKSRNYSSVKIDDNMCMQSPPYVITVDPKNITNLGDKNSTFVSKELTNILPISKLINIDPSHNISPIYLQKPLNEGNNLKIDDFLLNKKINDANNPISVYTKTDNSLNKKSLIIEDLQKDCLRPQTVEDSDHLLSSYCRLGWENKKNNKSSLDNSNNTAEPSFRNVEKKLVPDAYKDNSNVQSETDHPLDSMSYVPHKYFENKVLKED